MRKNADDLYHRFRIACTIEHRRPGLQAEKFNVELREIRAALTNKNPDLPLRQEILIWIEEVFEPYFESQKRMVAEHQALLRSDFKKFLERKGLSLRKACLQMNLSPTILSQWSNGIYQSNPTNIEDAVRSLLQREASL